MEIYKNPNYFVSETDSIYKLKKINFKPKPINCLSRINQLTNVFYIFDYIQCRKDKLQFNPIRIRELLKRVVIIYPSSDSIQLLNGDLL